jgi:hypothetical protein
MKWVTAVKHLFQQYLNYIVVVILLVEQTGYLEITTNQAIDKLAISQFVNNLVSGYLQIASLSITWLVVISR